MTWKSLADKLNNMRLIYFGAIAVVVVYIIFLLTYLFSSRSWLLRTFYNDAQCYYHSADFPAKYFNEHTKYIGNRLAVAGIILASALIAYFIYRYKKNGAEQLVTAPQKNWLVKQWPFLLVLVPAIVGVLWGVLRAGISGDEIFSAVYCADMSMIKTWTYYMLPNNHFLFNMLCNAGSWLLGKDAVIMGRSISVLSYLVMLWVAWRWLRWMIGHQLPAVLATVVLALQLPVYLFAMQSRGYELQLICTWVSFVSLIQYGSNSGVRYLRMFAVSSVIAFACIPTYLYFFMGQLCFAVSIQLLNKRVDGTLLRYILFVVIGTALFYIPSLCFSGIGAYTDNEYVRSGTEEMSKFLQAFDISLYIYVNAMFSSFVAKDHIINMVLFALPVALFFFRDRQRKMLGLFYVLLWLSWAALCFKMQRMPFSRNMIPYASVSLAIVLYTIYSLLRSVAIGYAGKVLASLAFMLFVIVFAINQFKWCGLPRNFNEEADANTIIVHELATLDKSKTLACSSWSYSYYYFARKQGYTASLCASGNEAYYINMKEEPLPPGISAGYTLLKHTPDGYDIYTHK